MSENDTVRADFLEERFRDEFLPAFNAWLNLSIDGSRPPGSPFELPEYQIESYKESDRLLENASASFERAKEANQISDNYILTTVLFAMVLFISGVGAKWNLPKVKIVLFIAAIIIFLSASAMLVWLPKNIGI